VLEELSHALGRGAKIYAEVLAQSRSCEAYHPMAPHPDGWGVARAMEKAFRVARIARKRLTISTPTVSECDQRHCGNPGDQNDLRLTCTAPRGYFNQAYHRTSAGRRRGARGGDLYAGDQELARSRPP
jgi:hypothetical protein